MINWLLQVSLSGVLVSLFIYVNMSYKEYKRFIYNNLDEISYLYLCPFIDKQYSSKEFYLERKIYKEYIFLTILSKIICNYRYKKILNENIKEIVIKPEDIKRLDKNYEYTINDLHSIEKYINSTEKIIDIVGYEYIKKIKSIINDNNINEPINECIKVVKNEKRNNDDKIYGVRIWYILYFALYNKFNNEIDNEYKISDFDLTIEDLFFIVNYWFFKYIKNCKK